jgi:hypothetical protein
LDNEAPQVSISYPETMDVLSMGLNEIITFLINVQDNLGLDRVEYYIDGDLIATQTNSPYAYPWNCKPGTFNLLVRAIDKAGNSAEDEVTFIVE